MRVEHWVLMVSFVPDSLDFLANLLSLGASRPSKMVEKAFQCGISSWILAREFLTKALKLYEIKFNEKINMVMLRAWPCCGGDCCRGRCGS